MTKKQFMALADWINRHNASCRGDPLGHPFNATHLESLAAFIATQNPKFAYQRWLDYVKEQS